MVNMDLVTIQRYTITILKETDLNYKTLQLVQILDHMYQGWGYIMTVMTY